MKNYINLCLCIDVTCRVALNFVWLMHPWIALFLVPKIWKWHIVTYWKFTFFTLFLCFSLSQHIMKQLVEAAIQLHSDGVFHRDIKTENVLVEFNSDRPRVWIIDFGCGCFIRKKPFRSFSGMISGFCSFFLSIRGSLEWWLSVNNIPHLLLCIVGTSAYIPPEFYVQGQYKAGPTTVWQLGALLYELLDGHKQFKTSEFLSTTVSFFSEIRLMKVSQGKTMLVTIPTWAGSHTNSLQSFVPSCHSRSL